MRAPALTRGARLQVVFGDAHDAPVDTESEARSESSGEARSLGEKIVALCHQFREPLITETALVVHAVLEATIVGFADTRRDVFIFWVAIALHKGFAAMSIATRFLRKGASPVQLFFLLLPYHLLPPAAILVAAAVGSSNPGVSTILSALATGTILYIGAYEVISEEFGPQPAAVETTPAAKKVAGSEDGSDPEVAGVPGANGKAWVPSKAMKFAAFSFGTLLLIGLLAAVPHDHGHA